MIEMKGFAYVAAVLAACGVMVGCRSNKGANAPRKTAKLALLESREVVPPPYRAPQFVSNNLGSASGTPIPQIVITGGEDAQGGDYEADFVPADTTQPPSAPAPQYQPAATPQYQPAATPQYQSDYASPADASPKQPAPRTAGQPAPSRSLRTYTVVKGDTLSGIGYMYQIPWQDLAAENNLTGNSILKEGMVLVLPERAAKTPRPRQVKKAAPKAAPAAPATKKAPAPANSAKAADKPAPKGTQPLPADGIYTVAAKDSLWLICHKFGLKGEDVRALNPTVNFNNLQIGQKIRLTDGKGAPKTAPAPKPAQKNDAPKPPTPPAPQAVTPPALPEAAAPAPQVPAPPAPEPAAPAPAPAAPAPAPAAPAAGGLTVPTVPQMNELAPEPSPITPAPANNAEQPQLP